MIIFVRIVDGTNVQAEVSRADFASITAELNLDNPAGFFAGEADGIPVQVRVSSVAFVETIDVAARRALISKKQADRLAEERP